MHDCLFKKGLVYGIIVLLVGVAALPASGTLNNVGNTLKVQQNAVGSTNQGDDVDWIELDKLIASDGTILDLFGNSVSISGDYAVIGAYQDNENGIYSGSAYIFKRDGISWTQQAKLLASDGQIGDRFGFSVSIDGDYAIIGAPGENFCKGSAYIFKRDGTNWVQKAKIKASYGHLFDKFGISVFIKGDTVIVGADACYYDTILGKAYIFKRDGESWTQQAKLQGSDSLPYDEFGWSVSFDGDYAVVGAPYGDVWYDNIGSAYVFKRSETTWVQVAKLKASDGTYEDFFGCSVSIEGDTIFIGACHDVDNEEDSGAVYIFKRDGTSWNEEAKLIASDGLPKNMFGCSVSIDGDYAIIGAFGDNENGNWSGSAYIFKQNGTSWNEEAKLIASDGAYGDEFGWPVSIDGDYAILGAKLDDDNGEDSGSAYIFRNIYEDQAPNTPTITGPVNGKVGTPYDYNFTSVDPDGDEICYYIEWGDGATETTDFYPSGEEVTVSHTWDKKGTYIIQAKAKDIYGAGSDWAELTVTMPRNRATYNSFLLRFLEQFPILQKILLYLIE